MFSQLKSSWIVGWNNIITKKYVGESNGYTCGQTSVGTTNGAGPHNVQLFMLSPDGIVLNVMPGFWHPDDLARELVLAQRLMLLWQDASKTRAEKDALFTKWQLAAASEAPKLTRMRSRWQGFDAKNEAKRVARGDVRDTIEVDAQGQPVLSRRGKPKMKSTHVVVKGRMAKRPFVPFDQFDTAVFADYGRRYYDNNKKVDGKGSTFMTPRRVEKANRRANKKARKQARRERRAKRKARRRARLGEGGGFFP